MAGRSGESRRRVKQRALRERTEAVLRDLAPERTCTVEQFLERLATSRGRPIHIVPMVLPKPGPCGIWVATDEVDVVVHETDTSRPHQEHIILHELAHMICAHRDTGDVDVTPLFPDLDPAYVRGMLMRSAYSSDQEQEAEIMATMLLDRLNRGAVERTWPEPSGITADLDRFLKRP